MIHTYIHTCIHTSFNTKCIPGLVLWKIYLGFGPYIRTRLVCSKVDTRPTLGFFSLFFPPKFYRKMMHRASFSPPNRKTLQITLLLEIESIKRANPHLGWWRRFLLYCCSVMLGWGRTSTHVGWVGTMVKIPKFI